MTEMKFIFVFVLPVLFSTTLDRADKVERFLTEYPSLYWSGILPVTVHTEKMEVYRSDHTCSKTILVSYLGPSRGLYKYVLRSCTLPLAGRNVSAYLVYILHCHPSYHFLQPFTGGSGAISLETPSHPHSIAKEHPLRFLSSFLHPLTVFSTLLVGGSIVTFALTMIPLLFTIIWFTCSYCVDLIHPYPCRCICYQMPTVPGT